METESCVSVRFSLLQWRLRAASACDSPCYSADRELRQRAILPVIVETESCVSVRFSLLQWRLRAASACDSPCYSGDWAASACDSPCYSGDWELRQRAILPVTVETELRQRAILPVTVETESCVSVRFSLLQCRPRAASACDSPCYSGYWAASACDSPCYSADWELRQRAILPVTVQTESCVSVRFSLLQTESWWERNAFRQTVLLSQLTMNRRRTDDGPTTDGRRTDKRTTNRRWRMRCVANETT